jgi:uncharacterized alkaline shock family protein YloU
MKVVHRFLFLLVFALLVTLGISLLVLSFSEKNWAILEELLPGSRLVGGAVGGGIFCLASLLFLTGLNKPRRSNRFLSFSNEQGVVNISTDAISEYISKLAPEFPSIVKMTTEIIPHRRKVDILVSVRIKAGSQVHEICEVLQQKIRESMEKGLGINDVERVIVSVEKISTEHKS